ncbi:enterotoxin-like protein, partial [Yersinia pestis PY-66]
MAFKNIVSLISKNERYKLIESKVNILDTVINSLITKKDSSHLNEI